MNSTEQVIIEKARFIARTLGVFVEDEERMERCACHIKESKSTSVFRNEALKIMVGNDTLEMSITRRENNNPVVVSNAEGFVYRYHGEFTHLVDEINAICSMIMSQR